MKMNFNDVKQALKARCDSTKHFDKGFYSLYVKSLENVRKSLENDNKNDVYEKDGIILRHSFDEIYNTKFYNDNSCAYCEFLSIVCGNELV